MTTLINDNITLWQKSYDVPNNFTVKYTKVKLEEVNIYKGSKVEKLIDKMTLIMQAQSVIINDVIEATKKLKGISDEK